MKDHLVYPPSKAMSIQEIDDQLFDARDALRSLIEQAPLGDDLTAKAREALYALYEIRVMLLSVDE